MENTNKVLSFTYDETKSATKNLSYFVAKFIGGFDLRLYDVIEFKINRITYNCTCSFAMHQIRKVDNPQINYHKIISKNVPSKN